MNLIIRQATIDDLEMLTELFDQYRIWYKQHSDADAARQFLQERITKKASVVFIAFVNGQPSGFTQLYPIFSSVRMKAAFLLNDLFVASTARNQGVAAGLLDAATQYGKATGAAYLMLQTGFENVQAQALYEKCGWKKARDFIYVIDTN